MAIDPSLLPRVPAVIIAGIDRPDVLLRIGPGSIAVLHVRTKSASSTWSGFSIAEVEQLVPLTIEAGAAVIDARGCSEDAYRHLIFCGPLVEVGGMKRLRIIGETHALSAVSIADYAPLFAAIGAVVHNMPAPAGEPEAAAA